MLVVAEVWVEILQVLVEMVVVVLEKLVLVALVQQVQTTLEVAAVDLVVELLVELLVVQE
tara:strand:+ start:443 stop:622 length:180 start_codon:yes stop_codon:yes gene_type:complete